MGRFLEDFTLRPEWKRALRATLAFVVPLVMCHALGRRSDAVFIAMAAQTIALPDLRGAYGMRLFILGTMMLVVAFAAMLGVWCGGSMWAAILAAGLMALLGGVWRHLSTDYGPQLSVASALLFLLGLSLPGSMESGWHLAGLILIGSAWAALLHVGFWLFRPQHPLRYAVGETWVALADVIASMRPKLEGVPEVSGTMMERERGLREALDRTFVILGAAESKGRSALLLHLEEMRREAIHLAMRVTGLHAALEPLLEEATFAEHLPTLDSVLKALSDATRSVAIMLISHRQENLAVTEVRLQRCEHLIHVFEEQMSGEDCLPQLRDALGKIILVLPRIAKTLGETMDHGRGRTAIPSRLPELTARPMHSLAAWINPSSQVDPVLVRHAWRMAVLMMGGVAIYKGFEIPHGYWIAFTMVVVLQPDYGSTREKAVQRIGGTLAGSLLGSALLWVRWPLPVLDALAGVMAFGFAYFSKLRYGVAVFFVTLMIVLMTETTGPVHLDFTVTRLLCNGLGGLLALVSALVFWPVWEGGKFDALLAAAIRANRDYLATIAMFLGDPATDVELFLVSKRRAENANRHASASLQRLVAEPKTADATADRGTALTTYNQRITRALTAIAVHLEEGVQVARGQVFQKSIVELDERLKALAVVIENEPIEERESVLERLQSSPDFTFGAADEASPENRVIWNYFAKSITETQAMALALESSLVH